MLQRTKNRLLSPDLLVGCKFRCCFSKIGRKLLTLSDFYVLTMVEMGRMNAGLDSKFIFVGQKRLGKDVPEIRGSRKYRVTITLPVGIGQGEKNTCSERGGGEGVRTSKSLQNKTLQKIKISTALNLMLFRHVHSPI